MRGITDHDHIVGIDRRIVVKAAPNSAYIVQSGQFLPFHSPQNNDIVLFGEFRESACGGHGAQQCHLVGYRIKPRFYDLTVNGDDLANRTLDVRR